MIEMPIHIQHVFSLLSAPAFLGGIVCLAAGLSCVERALSATAPHFAAPCPAPTSRRALMQHGGGMACVLGSFLLLPTGAFPAYITCAAAMPVWLLLFAMACVALAQYAPQMPHSTGPALPALLCIKLSFVKVLFSRLAMPGLVFAVCARYAWQHGFPGNIWAMDVYVALPLYTGAEPWRVAGFIVLAAVMVLWGSALPICHKAPVFSACVRLAAAQFTVCLFFPVPYMRLYIWPAVNTQASQTILPALLTDYALNWGLVLGLCLIFRVIGCAPFILKSLNVSLPVLVTLGAVLCLW